MKRKFLNIISCYLALFIFVGSFVFYVPSRVSAAVPSLPSQFPSNIDPSILEYLDDLKANPNFNEFTGQVAVLLSPLQHGGVRALIIQVAYSTELPAIQWVRDHGFVYAGSYAWVDATPSTLSTVNFSLVPYDSSVEQPCIVKWDNLDHYEAGFGYVQNGSYVFTGTDHNLVYLFSFDNSFVPDYSLTGVVVGFDFSVEAFTQWLIDTGKYAELPSYIGTQKLKSFVQFYHDWGSSNSIFVIRLVEWFMHFNIASQTIENRNIIKSTIDRLYQEYKNSAFVQINHDSSILPHHRKNIETNTTDDDLTLVTDDPSDDTLISILRDILRGVISIPNSIYDNTQVIIAKLDQLNHNIIISNNGGASSGTDLNPVLNKMDDIIDKLESDTVSVDIDQTTKDDTDDFFDDWNLQFSTALNNKFPVASQLRTFFTGFFERCGIDADSDGEVYQYYNPGVLTASSVSRSSVTSSEDDIVNDFLCQFDNSDPAFLDDASFHGVPDLSVSVGGHSVSIIDFRVYAKYRDKIHFIISFVIWTLYLLHLYKALPSIIGQVADVATKTSEL